MKSGILVGKRLDLPMPASHISISRVPELSRLDGSSVDPKFRKNGGMAFSSATIAP